MQPEKHNSTQSGKISAKLLISRSPTVVLSAVFIRFGIAKLRRTIRKSAIFLIYGLPTGVLSAVLACAV